MWLLLGSSYFVMASHFPGPVGSDPRAYPPNDPKYPDAWQLLSTMPDGYVGTLNADESGMGAGIWVDRAWQLHTGAAETIVAILDSGIYWDEEDLVDKHFLNHRELPLPHLSANYDRNGDGRFSIRDYEGDPRVSDENGNGILDPGDLIAVFSDGIDTDGNGFVDDIAGWDFFEGDNDPADRTRFGHGTAEARDSVAELNNGIGQAGICGGCTFIALRVDDSFVIDAQSFAAAVYYATDIGANIIQQALGSINWSPYVRDAVEYSYDHDVTIIGSAADENSYHHNYPSTIDPIVYPNAIRFDASEFRNATTFLNFNNCSNYGARVDVSVSGKSCSSEATANLSGAAALAWSYGQSLGRGLSAGELIALIKGTTQDIQRDAGPYHHQTFAGWDTITGYGRVNAFHMLTAIRDNEIPPVARITTPHWFEVIPQAQPEIAVHIESSWRQGPVSRLELQVARGVETASSDWRSLAVRWSSGTAWNGEIARFPLSVLTTLSGQSHHLRNRDAYTLRLIVEDAGGRTSEARRTIFIADDDTLADRFPIRLSGSGESTGLFADLNRDGADEFIVADGGGMIHAFQADGRELDPFPVSGAPSRFAYPVAAHRRSDVYAAIFAPIASGDLDGDGELEIVAATTEGHVIVIRSNGEAVAGFPYQIPFVDADDSHRHQRLANGILAAPTLADLNGDGALEIIIAAMDGQIHAIDASGDNVPGFPVALIQDGKRAKIVSSPAIHDFNRDDVPDIVVGTNHVSAGAGSIFAIDGRGVLAPSPFLSGFPTRIPVIRDQVLPTIGQGVPTSPIVADIDGDGDEEIIVYPFVGKTYIINRHGNITRSMSTVVATQEETNDDFMLAAFGHPLAADLDGDGILDPVAIGVGRRVLTNLLLGGKRWDYDHLIGAWNGATGDMLDGFPRRFEDMALGVSGVAADLGNDGTVELIAGSSGYFVHAWNQTGPFSGFPKFTGGWIFGTPALGDIDGDGLLDIATTTREGFVFVWQTTTRLAEAVGLGSWPQYQGNNQRTGSL